jgi:hypothetical protein
MLSYEFMQPFMHQVPVVFSSLMDTMSTASRGSWGWHREAIATPLIIFWWGQIPTSMPWRSAITPISTSPSIPITSSPWWTRWRIISSVFHWHPWITEWFVGGPQIRVVIVITTVITIIVTAAVAISRVMSPAC